MRSNFDISSWQEIEKRVLGWPGVEKLSRSEILALIQDVRDAAYAMGRADEKASVPAVGLPISPQVNWSKDTRGGRNWMKEIAEKAKRRV